MLILLFEELPPQTSPSTGNQEDSPLEALHFLFLDHSGNETFYGFDNSETPDLETIFSTDNDIDEFFGF